MARRWKCRDWSCNYDANPMSCHACLACGGKWNQRFSARPPQPVAGAQLLGTRQQARSARPQEGLPTLLQGSQPRRHAWADEHGRTIGLGPELNRLAVKFYQEARNRGFQPTEEEDLVMDYIDEMELGLFDQGYSLRASDR